MKYFRLDKSYDAKITGTGPYSQIKIDKKSFRSQKYFEQFDAFFSFETYYEQPEAVPNFEVKVDKGFLQKKAKLTDIMSYYEMCPQIPFLINEKVKVVFEKFNLNGVFFYPVTLYNDGKKVVAKYYLLHILSLNYDAIDFKRSIIIKSDTDRKVLKVNTLADYLELLQESKMSSFTKLVIKKKYLFTKDIIKVRGTGTLFISENLKDTVVKEQITGSDFYNVNLEVV